jgi:hypothetical protein
MGIRLKCQEKDGSLDGKANTSRRKMLMTETISIPKHEHCNHTPKEHEDLGWTCDLWPLGGVCCVGYVMSKEEPLIPNLNTLADVIDRLIVEVNKLSFYENKKREEHAKDHPSLAHIAKWDKSSRDCCEYRSMLKNEINRILAEVVANADYTTLTELRTFRAPDRSVSDIIADRCYKLGDAAFSGELAEAIEEELNARQQ